MGVLVSLCLLVVLIFWGEEGVSFCLLDYLKGEGFLSVLDNLREGSFCL